MRSAGSIMSIDVKLIPQFTRVLITQVTGHTEFGNGLRRDNNFDIKIDLDTNLISFINQTKFKDFQNAKSYVERLRDKFLEVTNTKQIKCFNYGLEEIEPVFLKGRLKDQYELLQVQILNYKKQCTVKGNPLMNKGMINTDYNRLAEELEFELKEDLEAELKNNNYEF